MRSRQLAALPFVTDISFSLQCTSAESIPRFGVKTIPLDPSNQAALIGSCSSPRRRRSLRFFSSCVDVTVVDLRVIISWPASASPRSTLLPTNIRNILIKSSHSNSPVSQTNSQILLTFFDFSLDSHHYTRTDLLASSIRKQKHSCTEAAACFVLPAHTQPQALP